MSTVGELLNDKKNNFCNYLLTIVEDEKVKEKLTEDTITLFKNNVDKLKNVSTEIFIFWITNDLFKRKDKLEEYPSHFLKVNGIEEIEEIEPYKPKIIAYLKLFIDLLAYSFEDEEDK